MVHVAASEMSTPREPSHRTSSSLLTSPEPSASSVSKMRTKSESSHSGWTLPTRVRLCEAGVTRAALLSTRSRALSRSGVAMLARLARPLGDSLRPPSQPLSPRFE